MDVFRRGAVCVVDAIPVGRASGRLRGFFGGGRFRARRSQARDLGQPAALRGGRADDPGSQLLVDAVDAPTRDSWLLPRGHRRADLGSWLLVCGGRDARSGSCLPSDARPELDPGGRLLWSTRVGAVKCLAHGLQIRNAAYWRESRPGTGRKRPANAGRPTPRLPTLAIGRDAARRVGQQRGPAGLFRLRRQRTARTLVGSAFPEVSRSAEPVRLGGTS